MKYLLSALIAVVLGSVYAQGGFVKGKKGNDYIMVKKNGYHFAFGGTYTLTGDTIFGTFDRTGSRGDFTVDPKSNFGFFAEFGLLQFPTWKGIPIKFLKKKRIMDYWEFAFGYRQLSGSEITTNYYHDALGQTYASEEFRGDFVNGFVYTRASAHSLIFVGKKKIDQARKYFIDQSLGFNVDYNMFQSEKRYNDVDFTTSMQQRFHGQLIAQLHYSLGYGIRINRAWMCIPGVSLPILGIYEWNGFNANLNWFSSKYWPVQFQLKFNKLYERVPKCGAYGRPEDVEMDKKYRMGSGN